MDDPFEWTLDQVIAFFCGDRDFWDEKRRSRLPERGALENDLRRHDIDGETLLQHMNFETLRVDLGITSVRGRSSICYGIAHLQQRSLAFTSARNPRLDATNADQLATTPFTPHLQQRLATPLTPNSNVVTTPRKHPSETLELDGPRKKRRLQLGPPLASAINVDAFLGLKKYKLPIFHVADEDDGEVHDDSDDGIAFVQASPTFPVGVEQVMSRRLRRMFRADSGPWDTRPDHTALSGSVHVESDAQDEVLPAYGDSGSENEFDQDLYDEIETENLERTAQSLASKHLDAATEQQVIDDAISDYISSWQERRLPRLMSKARSAWKQRSHRLSSLVKGDLSCLQQRLGTIRKSIARDQFASKAQLSRQCNSLQPTVAAIELAQWRLELWKGPRPSKDTQAPNELRNKATATMHSDDSGEDLDSNSDAMSFLVGDKGLSQSLKGSSTAVRGYYTVSDSDLVSNSDVDMSEVGEVVLKIEDSDADSLLGHVEAPAFLRGPRNFAYVDLTVLSSQDSQENQPDEDIGDDDSGYGPNPETASESEITAWTWKRLDEQADVKRIVIKLLQEMPAQDRRQVDQQFLNCKLFVLAGHVEKAVLSIKKGRSTIRGYSPATSTALLLCGRLWICWQTGVHSHFAMKDFSDGFPIEAKAMDDYETFHDFVRSIIVKAGDYPDLQEHDSDDDEPGQQSTTTRKKRKNLVVEDRESQQIRNQALTRAARQHDILGSQLTSSQDGRMQVNSDKGESDEPIFVNPSIARSLKPHQERGIRFMWREIIASNQGCLLAHTMGLGKTVQTIALLLTIAEASVATENIVQQIPGPLRGSRTLILCPATLVQNWKDECQKWLPNSALEIIGDIYAVTSLGKVEQRAQTITEWYKYDGLLIMGYDLFRSLVTFKPRKEVNESMQTIKKYLLEGPKIVVADEAHKLKNQTTGISRAVHGLATTARIALTGSPLANNLQDYHAMIDWAAPNYLGTQQSFRARYKEPIEAGLYAESTSSEQRRSLKTLHKLKRVISPKIDRADITVLLGDLVPKTEFVINILLTDLQKELYIAFVRLNRQAGIESNTRIFTMLSYLKLLCNHPVIFRSKIKSEARSISTSARKTQELDRDSTDRDVEPLPLSIVEKLAAMQDEIFRRFTQEPSMTEGDLTLSNKMQIIATIVSEAKQAGEKTLVFSHSIQTLDYIAMMFDLQHVKHLRLDGATKMQDRQDLVSTFAEDAYDAFLISTRAGGLGLNITAANRVILVDFEFSPAHEEQAVGRSYRIGQRKEVFVYHIVTSDSYESKMHDVTIFKKQVAFRVVDNKAPQRFASKVGEYVFEPGNVEKQALDSYLGKDTIMDHILNGPLREQITSLHTTETMHVEKEEPLTEEEQKQVDEELLLDRQGEESGHARTISNAINANTVVGGSLDLHGVAVNSSSGRTLPRFRDLDGELAGHNIKDGKPSATNQSLYNDKPVKPATSWSTFVKTSAARPENLTKGPTWTGPQPAPSMDAKFMDEGSRTAHQVNPSHRAD